MSRLSHRFLIDAEYLIERKQQPVLGDNTHFLGYFSERISEHLYKFINVHAFYWSPNGWTDIMYDEKIFDDRYYNIYSPDGNKRKKKKKKSTKKSKKRKSKKYNCVKQK